MNTRSALWSVTLLLVSLLAADAARAAALILNEYNAVREDRPLEDGAADPVLGNPAGTPVDGNGSRGAPIGERNDWFELVVVADGLDVRGWSLSLEQDGTPGAVLVFADDALWSDLAAGTIITIFEADDLSEDTAYDPAGGDYTIAVRTNDAATGALLTATDIDVTNSNFQLTIFDHKARRIFGPAGEGIAPASGIGSDEVFKLEVEPSALVTENALEYNDGSSSTFGAPNSYSGGTIQDFSALRSGSPFLDEDRDGSADCRDTCRFVSNPSQVDTDADGFGDACDADYDNDGVVGLSDFNALRNRLGESEGDPGFDPRFDHDDDGTIGDGDLQILNAGFGSAPGPGAEAGQLCDVSDPTEVLFDPDRFVIVEIEMDPADFDALRVQTREPDVALKCEEEPPVSPYTYFPADVTIDGTLVSNVGVRKKGFQGSLSTTRPSFKVKFGEFVSGQRFEGIDRLTLNNNLQDISRIQTCLAYYAMEQAGNVAPRCNLARVFLNGVDLGIYSNVESIKPAFLVRSFGTAAGNLYEGTVSDLRRNYFGTFEIKENGDRSDLLELAHLLEGTDAEIEAEIANHLDVDQFMTFWAMEGLIGHWDGYNSNNNNFYVYNEPGRGLVFFPWGADDTFGENGAVAGDGSPIAQVVVLDSKLADRLYGIPTFQAQYFARLAELRDLLFPMGGSAAMLAKIDQLESVGVPAGAPGTNPDSTAEIERIRGWVQDRFDHLASEVDFTDANMDGIPDGIPAAPGLPVERFCLVPDGAVDVDFTTTVTDTTDDPSQFCPSPLCRANLFGDAPFDDPQPVFITAFDRNQAPIGGGDFGLLLLALTGAPATGLLVSVDPTLVDPAPSTLAVPGRLGAGVNFFFNLATGDTFLARFLGNIMIDFDQFGANIGDTVAGNVQADLLTFAPAPDNPLPPLPAPIVPAGTACGLGFELVFILPFLVTLRRRRLGRRQVPALVAVALLLVAPTADAGPILEVVFTSQNGGTIPDTSSVGAIAGDTLTAVLRLTADGDGVSSYAASIQFDADGADELDLISVTETTPSAFDVDLGIGPLGTSESMPGTGGEILSIAAGSTGPGITSSSVDLATLVFQVTANLASDGIDLVPFFASGGVDGIFGSAGQDLAPATDFFGASVDNVPEPAGLALLAMAALGWRCSSRGGRRRRA